MQVTLTIQERLKDLRTERGLTLEELSKETGISKSALAKYESDDFNEISSYNLVALAIYYGVSTDYVLALTDQKKHPNTELDLLHLDDKTIDILSSGEINNRLLCEMICHENFEQLLSDIEIYVDHLAAQFVQTLNEQVRIQRDMIQSAAEEKEINLDNKSRIMRTLDAGLVDDQQYFNLLIHNDLDQITKDIKTQHEKDTTTADKDNPASEMVREISNAFATYLKDPEKIKQNHIEWIARRACESFSVDYDKLPYEDQEAFKRIISKMPGAKNPVSKRGKHKNR